MKEMIPTPESTVEQAPERPIDLSLNDKFFDNLDAFTHQCKNEEDRKNLGELTILAKKEAFRYTESVLDYLRSDDVISNQEEKSWFAYVRRSSHESLELNFNVIARALKREGTVPSWFDAKRSGLRDFKEKQEIKIISLKYALRSTFRYRELASKEARTSEESREFSKLTATVNDEEVKNILRKFEAIPKFHQEDFIEKLGL